MAFTQTDLDAVNAAIATGARARGAAPIAMAKKIERTLSPSRPTTLLADAPMKTSNVSRSRDARIAAEAHCRTLRPIAAALNAGELQDDE
jgi:hypothetical protein